ncbi:MAG: DUF3078 domain-containing protein [Saprospiraceae bacterium]|nr:DUF3078 domain-containing protein [Saprospiraceae bacterium]
MGIGGALGFTAKYKRNLVNWKNDLMLNLSTQRIGSGTIGGGSDLKLPFEKALDIFTISSNFAYKVNQTSPWAYSADLMLITQFLGSHLDSATNKIYLSELQEGAYNTKLISKLFSLQQNFFCIWDEISKGPQMVYFSVSRCLKTIYIANQDIANLGVHGTQLKKIAALNTKTWYGVGALARGGYAGTFLSD